MSSSRPQPGFSGNTTVTFELCDAGGCYEDPVNGVFAITVAANQQPDVDSIPNQNIWVGIPFDTGLLLASDPEGQTLSYTDNLPPGLSVNAVAGGFTVTGTVTDPSYLNQSLTYTVIASDPDGANRSRTITLNFSDQGLSPYAGQVLLTEVLKEPFTVCLPIVGCQTMQGLRDPQPEPAATFPWTAGRWLTTSQTAAADPTDWN